MPLHKKARLMVWLMPISFWLWCGLAFLNVSSASAQSLEDAQQKFLRGNYEDVIKIAKKQVEDGSSSDWRILLVRSLMTVGRYGDAYTNAQNGVNDYPMQLRSFLLARETALYQNNLNGANRRLMQTQDILEQRRGLNGGDNLVAAGEAMLLLGVEPQVVLQNCFRPAEQADPPPREAFLASGNLALNKHDFSLAADAFRAGLKKFPGDPDMESGLAMAFEPSDREQMMVHIEPALKTNPHHIPTLLLLVDHLIDAEEY